MPAWRTTYRSPVLLLLAVLASSCGGGGGGSGGSGGPAPPGGDTAFGTLALNDGNVHAIALALSLSEGALAFPQMAANAIVKFASAAGAPEASCGNVGTLTVDHEDRDGSFDVTPGDVLHVTLVDCFDPTIDAIGNGTFDVSITDFALGATTGRIAGELSMPTPFTIESRVDPALVTAVTAALDFDFRIEETLEVISVRAAGSQFLAVGSDGITETISEFELMKSATRTVTGTGVINVDTEVGLSFFYDSELLGGSFTCASTDFRFAEESNSPTDAEIQCTGLNRSAVRVTDVNQVELDPDGDGNFTHFGALNWSDVISHFLSGDSGLVLADLVGQIDLRRLAVTARDVVYDAARDRVLITTTAADPVSPSSLLEVTLSSNTRRTAITFSSEPDLVRLSEDGTLLYLSFTGSAEIRRYDAATLQLLSTIQMQTEHLFTPPLIIRDIAVSPLDPSVIAVAFGSGFNVDVAIVDGDQQLASSARDIDVNDGGIEAIEYSADGTRIFAGGGGRVLGVDTTGIASRTWARASFSGFQLQRVDDRLYSGPLALDEQSLVRLGTYFGQGNAFGVDSASNFVFRFGAEQLAVYRLDRFVPLASYGLPLDLDANIRDIVPAGQFALLVGDDALHIVDYADIETLNSGVCAIESLATDEGEPYTRYACPVADAVYDPARLKIYAAINRTLGVNGNSIAVIDDASGLVERYVHIGSEPRKIGISTDGNLLYAIFQGADTVAALDLNTFEVTRSVQLDLVPAVNQELERHHALDFAVSPAESDAVVISTTTLHTTDRFIAIRNGTVLAGEVLASDMQSTFSFSERRPFFDGSGTGYSLGSQGDDAAVESLLLGPDGLSLGPFFEATPVFVGEGQFDVVQDEVFTAAGEVIDLSEQTVTVRYDSGLAANADLASGQMFILLDVGTGPLARGNAGIRRYDYLNGALLAEQRVDSFLERFPGVSLFDVGTDRLGVVASPTSSSGLIIIDKAAIQ